MATQVDLGWSLATAGFLLLLGITFVGYFGFSDDRHAGALWAAGATIVVVLSYWNSDNAASLQPIFYCAASRVGLCCRG